MLMVTLRINGKSHTVDASPEMPLLWVLRDLLGMNGTKFGCGVALCGACTVHIDGIPTRACVMPQVPTFTRRRSRCERQTGRVDASRHRLVDHSAGVERAVLDEPAC